MHLERRRHPRSELDRLLSHANRPLAHYCLFGFVRVKFNSSLPNSSKKNILNMVIKNSVPIANFGEIGAERTRRKVPKCERYRVDVKAGCLTAQLMCTRRGGYLHEQLQAKKNRGPWTPPGRSSWLPPGSLRLHLPSQTPLSSPLP